MLNTRPIKLDSADRILIKSVRTPPVLHNSVSIKSIRNYDFFFLCPLDEVLTACSRFQYCWFINLSMILSFLLHSHLSLVLCFAWHFGSFPTMLYTGYREFKCAFPVTLLSLHLRAESTNLQSFNKDGSCKTLTTKSLYLVFSIFFFFLFVETKSLGKTVI